MAARKRSEGFTLIEITFAIVILAGALVVLLGLQSSVVARTISDGRKQQAMLYARQILASVEMNEFEIEVEDFTGSVQEALEINGTVDAVDNENKIFDAASEMKVHYLVEPWAISPEYPEAMKKISLTLWWSENPSDKIAITYFIPFEHEQDDEAADDADPGF